MALRSQTCDICQFHSGLLPELSILFARPELDYKQPVSE